MFTLVDSLSLSTLTPDVAVSVITILFNPFLNGIDYLHSIIYTSEGAFEPTENLVICEEELQSPLLFTCQVFLSFFLSVLFF